MYTQPKDGVRNASLTFCDDGDGAMKSATFTVL